MKENYEDPKDVNDPGEIQIIIDADGKKVWINNQEKCLFRGYDIKKVYIDDKRLLHEERTTPAIIYDLYLNALELHDMIDTTDKPSLTHQLFKDREKLLKELKEHIPD